MTDILNLLKIWMAWATIVYLVCFVAVAIFPDIRNLFFYYALHVDLDLGRSVMTPITFVAGLAIWNVTAGLGAGLYGVLSNRIAS